MPNLKRERFRAKIQKKYKSSPKRFLNTIIEISNEYHLLKIAKNISIKSYFYAKDGYKFWSQKWKDKK